MYDSDARSSAIEGYQARINRLSLLIYKGFNGEDVREALAERLEAFEVYIPEYHDIRIGYVYYQMGEALYTQSLYSDVLRGVCHPSSIYVPYK